MRLSRPAGRDKREIYNILSADDAQSEAERILNRLTAPSRIKIAIPAAWCYTTYKI